MEHELLPPPALATEPAHGRRSAVLLAIAAAGLGLILGVGLGFAVGWVAMESALGDCSPSDGWCGLGAAIAGLFAGSIAGSIAYVTTGVVLIRRVRPKGRRAPQIVAHLALPFAMVTLAAVFGALTEALA